MKDPGRILDQATHGDHDMAVARRVIGAMAALLLLAFLAVGSFMVLASTRGLAQEAPAPSRWEAVDVYIDSGAQPLAAFQFELSDRTGRARIVGVEGGAHEAFSEPPYYDPRALMNNRIIIAAFDTGEVLPAGKTRVARLHFQVAGTEAVDYTAELMVAADAAGVEISRATMTFEKGK